MNTFIYDEIEITERRIEKRYKCDGKIGYSLLDILKKIGNDGWELIGEVEGRLIVKKEIV